MGTGNSKMEHHGLRRGVELTHRAAIQLLRKEGAIAIPAEHQPFDPNLHEAVATIPRNGGEVAPGTVIQVIEPGYRLFTTNCCGLQKWSWQYKSMIG